MSQLRDLYNSGGPVSYPMIPLDVVDVHCSARFSLLRSPDWKTYWVLGSWNDGMVQVDLKGVVYIAGPVRGYKDNNFPAFDEAAERFRKAGYYVFSPADMDRNRGITETSTDLTNDQLRKCFEVDCVAIARSSHIALLPGWEESAGVRPEAILSATIDVAFMDAVTLELLARTPVMRTIADKLLIAYS